MNEGWLEILGKMPYGIYVLTSRFGERINGMVASWVSQISYDPPLLMVAVHPNRYSHELIKKSGHFTLHLISRNQKGLISRFKGSDPRAKFDTLSWTEGKTECPILLECIGHMECVVKESYSPGNHTLFIGEIVDAKMRSNEGPMSTSDYEGTYTGMR
ncbi:MAG: flavin reductase family protein [Pseudomonadota bacterium]